jgi:hypothetical protein
MGLFFNYNYDKEDTYHFQTGLSIFKFTLTKLITNSYGDNIIIGIQM